MAAAAGGALAAGPLLLGCVAACPAIGSSFAGASTITQTSIVGGGLSGGFNLGGQFSDISNSGANPFDPSEYNLYTLGRNTAIGAAKGALAGANILAGTGFVMATAEASVLSGILGVSFNFGEQYVQYYETGEQYDIGEGARVFGQNSGGTIISAGIGRGVTSRSLSDSTRQSIGGFTLNSLIGSTGREVTRDIGSAIINLHNTDNPEPPSTLENAEEMNVNTTHE